MIYNISQTLIKYGEHKTLFLEEDYKKPSHSITLERSHLLACNNSSQALIYIVERYDFSQE